MKTSRPCAGGFTLVEIMIVVAIIALLAALSLPLYLRYVKRSHGTSIKNDLRLLEGALDQYTIERNLASGTVSFSDLRPYLKSESKLSLSGADILGNPYGPSFPLNSLPSIPAASKSALSEYCDASFWSPYQ